MTSLALCFSGGIASGKTTLSSAIAERRGITHASFGRFVRTTAKGRGIPEVREKLQDLGASLIDELGWDEFCSRVLAAAGWQRGQPVIVDGIRHVTGYETVGRIVSPMPTALVFLDAPLEVRDARKRQRGDVGTRDLVTLQTHSTEKDVVDTLRSIATLALDGTNSLEALVYEIETTIFTAGVP